MTIVLDTQKREHERQSTYLVIVFTLLALVLGWWLKTSIESNTRDIEIGGVSAAVPAGWIVSDGVGDLIFRASDPASGQRYLLSLAENRDEITLEDFAASRGSIRALVDETYRALEQTPVTVGSQEGFKQIYAFIDDPGEGHIPSVIQGVEYLFEEGGDIVIISLEAPVGDFEMAFDFFQRFRNSVSITGGDS